MKQSTLIRLLVVGFALVVVAAYLFTRDSIRVRGEISSKERRQIIAGIQEWSSLKLFRRIEIERISPETATARVRERGNRWSVTVFMKDASTWKRVGWYLLEETKPTVLYPANKPAARQEIKPTESKPGKPATQPRSNSPGRTPPAGKR